MCAWHVAHGRCPPFYGHFDNWVIVFHDNYFGVGVCEPDSLRNIIDCAKMFDHCVYVLDVFNVFARVTPRVFLWLL